MSSLNKEYVFLCEQYDKQSFLKSAGFPDLSPEEVRMEAYEAQKNGKFAEYVSW